MFDPTACVFELFDRSQMLNYDLFAPYAPEVLRRAFDTWARHRAPLGSPPPVRSSRLRIILPCTLLRFHRVVLCILAHRLRPAACTLVLSPCTQGFMSGFPGKMCVDDFVRFTAWSEDKRAKEAQARARSCSKAGVLSPVLDAPAHVTQRRTRLVWRLSTRLRR